MDSFTRNFFPNHGTPGVPFVLDTNQRVWCFAQHYLNVDIDGGTMMPKKIWQPMTPLGLFTAELQGLPFSYDGINKVHVTPEGTISIPSIRQELKQSSGK